jgi:hypothetical protein
MPWFYGLGVTSDVPSDLSAPPGIARQQGQRKIALLSVAAAVFLAGTVVFSVGAHALLVLKPTAAQRAAAAAEAVAARWHTWPAGRIFPTALSYSTGLLTTETASRVEIAPQTSCSDALAAAQARRAARDQCRAALRASYLDELQGVLFTVGILAFRNTREAAAFAAGLPATSATAFSLGVLALPGTTSSQFTLAARQTATARQDGPFVLLTVAGYADGEPAGAGQQARPSIFAPAVQLAAEVLAPLTRPVTVNCASPQWSC